GLRPDPRRLGRPGEPVLRDRPAGGARPLRRAHPPAGADARPVRGVRAGRAGPDRGADVPRRRPVPARRAQRRRRLLPRHRRAAGGVGRLPGGRRTGGGHRRGQLPAVPAVPVPGARPAGDRGAGQRPRRGARHQHPGRPRLRPAGVPAVPGLTRPRRCYVVCTEVPPNVVGGLGRYAERLLAALRDTGVPVEVFGAVGRRLPPRTHRTGSVTLHLLPTPGQPSPETPQKAPRRDSAGPRVPVDGEVGDAAGVSPRAGDPGRGGIGALVRVGGLIWFNVRVAARILRSGRRAGAVVAVHDWMGAVAGILCRVLGRTPVVFHVHTCEHNTAPGARRTFVNAGITALENAQARLADLIVVPSAGMRDELVARGWPKDRLRVVPHGYEDPELIRLAELPGARRDRLRAEVRERYLPGGAGRLVVFAGRLSPHKGVHTLIRAAALLRGRDDLRVVLI